MAKNKFEAELRGKDVLNKKVLILGEVGSGKTKLAAKIIQELMQLIIPREITVIDLAPERKGVVGGKLIDYADLIGKVRYLSPEKVYTPRLSGSSREEVLRYVELNRESMEPLLEEFVANPTEVLIVNDVTLYLHLGELETVLKCASLAKTFLATAYYGLKLSEDFGTGISSREQQLIDKLATFMDLVIKLASSG